MSGCLLFGFPPEIRNQIFEYTLYESPFIEIVPTNTKWLPPALTQTCVEIRHESLRLFYVVNTFRATAKGLMFSFLVGWLRSVGRRLAQYIGRLELVDLDKMKLRDMRLAAGTWTMLLRCIGLSGVRCGRISFQLADTRRNNYLIASYHRTYNTECHVYGLESVMQKLVGQDTSRAGLGLMWLAEMPRPAKIGLVAWPIRAQIPSCVTYEDATSEIWRSTVYHGFSRSLCVMRSNGDWCPESYWLDSTMLVRECHTKGKRKFDDVGILNGNVPSPKRREICLGQTERVVGWLTYAQEHQPEGSEKTCVGAELSITTVETHKEDSMEEDETCSMMAQLAL